MEIYAKGKNIPSFPFGGLLVQGEKLADTITFVLDRYYDGKDMAECSFLLRGVNENNEEAQQSLSAELMGEDKLSLEWSVSEYFTAVAGNLSLELRAVRMSGDVEELVLKYTMQPINVASSPSGENTPLPDTSEQLLNEISSAVSEGIDTIEQCVAEFNLDEVDARLDAMEEKTEIYLARPEVIPVTQSEYDSITHKQNALYVIVKE